MAAPASAGATAFSTYSPSSAASGRHPRVLILTALRVEHSAMREHLVDLREEEHEAGTRYEVGVLRGTACETARRRTPTTP